MSNFQRLSNSADFNKMKKNRKYRKFHENSKNDQSGRKEILEEACKYPGFFATKRRQRRI